MKRIFKIKIETASDDIGEFDRHDVYVQAKTVVKLAEQRLKADHVIITLPGTIKRITSRLEV